MTSAREQGLRDLSIEAFAPTPNWTYKNLSAPISMSKRRMKKMKKNEKKLDKKLYIV